MPALQTKRPSVASLIVAASNALELYQAGDLPAALAALGGFDPDPLPERPEWIATELERRHAATLAGGPHTGAALDYLDFARDRLRQELGEPVKYAIMPVPLALRSALRCLGAGS